MGKRRDEEGEEEKEAQRGLELGWLWFVKQGMESLSYGASATATCSVFPSFLFLCLRLPPPVSYLLLCASWASAGALH